MTRRTMAERKRRGADRIARRESLLVLLARARRGVTLTDAEAALLFAHVEVELAEADELRRTVQGQQTAIQVMGNRAEAADAVIVEVEQDRDQVRAELAELQAAARQSQQRARVERSAPDAEHAAMNRHLDGMRTRAEQAEEHLAAYVDIFGPDAPDDFHTMQHRAKQAEATLDRVRALARRMRAGSPQGAAAIYADRIEQTLGSLGGELTASQAAVHAAFAEAADSTEARLAEQQRAHEIELATVRRRGDGWKRHALDADHRADRYRTAWFAARRDRRADRAAMAAELPLVEAGRVALDRADLLAALTR
jgi:chromosome segregation ATPase